MDIKLNDRLTKLVESYCKVNSLDVDEFVVKVFSDGFNIERFGDLNKLISKNNVCHEVDGSECNYDVTNNVVTFKFGNDTIRINNANHINGLISKEVEKEDVAESEKKTKSKVRVLK